MAIEEYGSMSFLHLNTVVRPSRRLLVRSVFWEDTEEAAEPEDYEPNELRCPIWPSRVRDGSLISR